MSAFIVDDEHIHVLLDAAIGYNQHGMHIALSNGEFLTLTRENREWMAKCS